MAGASVGETRARPSALTSTTAPAGALQSPNFYAPHQPQWPNYDGPNSILRGYERTLYAMRCIDTIANSLAGLDFVVGNTRTKTPRDTAPLAQLLGPPPGFPNTRWSSAALWKYAIRQYLILGKWAWLHEYDSAGRIVGLWPLQAQYVIPIKAAQNSTQDYFEGYEYGMAGMPNYRRFRLDEISYFWRPSQRDLSQPESPVNLAAMEINVYSLLNQYDQGFLMNGGVPAHMIITPPWETKEDRSSFRRQFRRDFSGPANANKVMFAEREVEPGETGTTSPQAVEVVQLGQSQKDSQLDTLRKEKIYDICALFGVPLSILGRSENNKYDTADQDRINYWLETVQPLARDVADMVNINIGRLVSTTDAGWFDLSQVPELRPKPVIDPAQVPALLAEQVFTVDEIRKLNWDLDPLPEDAFPEPAAEPPLPAIESTPPTDAPPADTGTGSVVPVQAARAVRLDQLETLRGLLAVELADQRAEIERRRDGARGGRLRARAAVSLAGVYDTEHWHARMAKRLAPALDALGVRAADQDSYLADITAEVFDHLAGGMFGSAFDTDLYMNYLDAYLPTPGGVPIASVQAALMQLAAGRP
jgi:HK97 family phage portal protein